MSDCLCGSGRPLDDCCGAIIAGAPAPTAEALMRARYVAYVQGNIDFLAETLTPEQRAEFDQAEAASTAGDSNWQGLEIREVVDGGEGDDTGIVEFVARFKLRGESRVHHERTSFERRDGKWLCSDGEVDPVSGPRTVEKVGRNDPCPCGSGKKYKKCCGR